MKNLLKRQGKQIAALKPLPPLALCVLMDLLGCASYLIPFLGEFFDLIWAPISAIIYMKLFGGAKGVFGGVFNFLEELLPGLDIIPTFTITWFLLYHKRSKNDLSVSASGNHIHQF